MSKSKERRLKVQKPKRASIVKKLDAVFSQYIRERDQNTCITCGKVKGDGDVMTCGHLFSRVAYSTRWSELNASCQCWPCNFSHEFDFEPYRREFVKRHGIKKYNSLYLEFKKPKKYSDWELVELIEYYKNKLQALTEK